MSTKIAWCDETINPLIGCFPVSAGCSKCYAATQSGTGRLQQFPQYKGVVDGKGNWTGKVNFAPEQLEKLFKLKAGTRVFMPSMSDPFHENVPDEWLDRIMAVIALNPQVTVMMLTKRSTRMLAYFKDLDIRRLVPYVHEFNDARGRLTDYRWKIPSPNLALGVSVENQAAADSRSPVLYELYEMGWKTFYSVEPQLEDINLRLDKYPVNLCVNGGESGKDARPFNLEWARSLRDQCKAAGVPYFLKQLGSNPWENGKPLKLKDRKGTNLSEWPEDLRVQEHFAW